VPIIDDVKVVPDDTLLIRNAPTHNSVVEGDEMVPERTASIAQLGLYQEGKDLEKALSTHCEADGGHKVIPGFIQLIRPQKWFFIIGSVGGICAGSSFPVAGWMLGEAVQSLTDTLARPDVNTWSLWFLLLSIMDLFIYL
jgi:hypothetical protein